MKIKQLYPLAFIALLVMLTFISGCKKETSPDTETCRTVSQLRMSGTTPNFTLYVYDAEGRIAATIDNQIYAYLTYIADSANYVEYQTDGTLNNSYSLKVDANGRFITQDGRTYEYNSDGNLIREVANTVEYEYTWQDGNMVSSSTSINGVLSYVYTYTYYTDRENKARWDYNHSGINCFFGRASKNLIKHIKTVQQSNGDISETDWTYEFNEKGLPSQMTILFVGQNQFNTYTYTYECN